MPLPSGRVLAPAPAARRGVVQHRLDPAAEARSRLGLFLPDRLQHGQHLDHADLVHRPAAQHGSGVGGDSGGPLGPVLRVAPAVPVRLDVEPRHVIESVGRPCRGLAGLLAHRNRIVALVQQAAGIPGALPRIRQADVGGRAQAHLARLLPGKGVAERPDAGAAGLHEQIEVAAVGVTPGLPGPLYVEGGELACLHDDLSAKLTRSTIWSTTELWTRVDGCKRVWRTVSAKSMIANVNQDGCGRVRT